MFKDGSTTDRDFDGSESLDTRDDAPTTADDPDPAATEHAAPASGMEATYSPEDNKLRLRSAARLDQETYERVKAAGFRWAGRQKLFVAPMWTPDRADLLVELCGEIGDEDTSLVERAEERAEAFEGYSDNRAADAETAKAAVERIADGIPLGQPILVGHHSERHARKDAEKIKAGMRKAVKMWETAQYWERRAAGALRHARYKERPDVRYRRIKGLEADKRKQEKIIAESESFNKLWRAEGLTRERATAIANYDHVRVYSPTDPYGETLWGLLDKDKIAPAEAAERAIRAHDASIAYHRRWLSHIELRLTYERAMLGEVGGLKADRFPIEVGGKVLAGPWWRRQKGYLVVLRVTKKDGAITSVRVNGEGVVSIEEIEDYQAPQDGDAEKVKAVMKLAPLVNYPGEGFRHMAKADFDKRKGSGFYCIRKIKATDKHGAHRRREAPREGGQYYELVGVYLTDQKRVDPPPAAPSAKPELPAPAPPPPSEPRPAYVPPERTAFDDMKDSLKSGVVVVSAPQLFPTPLELAKRMVKLARVEDGLCVLEPSAGTGNIVRAVLDAVDTEVLAYEINQGLCGQLSRTFPSYKLQVRCRDFLAVTDFLGQYPRIVMNPPFADGQDIDHVMHAWEMLAPDGRLVSVMSAGVRFRQDKKTAAFRAFVESVGGEIEDLPEDAFKASGTSVRTVLVTLDKE